MDRQVTAKERSMKPIYYKGRTAKKKSASTVIHRLSLAWIQTWYTMSLMCFQRETAMQREMAAETIFSAVSSLYSAYLWKYSNTIIGTFFTLIAVSPWKQLRTLSPWVLILNTSWLWVMGKTGEGMKSQSPPAPQPERCRRCLGTCVCCRDYGLDFICISEQKEINPSKQNYQAVDHTANLHIWSTSEKQFPSN